MEPNNFDINILLKSAIESALRAGEAILEIYKTDSFEVEIKADQSPLTRADKAAHEIITKMLEPTGLPVLSEESTGIAYLERKNWKKFWLVDPLDGTKEFIKRNGEFTVNIALITGQEPMLGVVYAPVPDVMYFGTIELGSYRILEAKSRIRENGDFLSGAEKLPLVKHDRFGIVASRSHMNDETSSFIEGMTRKYPDARIVSKGSSLKLCLIAEGEADVYPRFAPTSEWDTAAGHAIVEASGGKVVVAKNDEPLRYNKKDILNPWFIAFRKEKITQ